MDSKGRILKNKELYDGDGHSKYKVVNVEGFREYKRS